MDWTIEEKTDGTESNLVIRENGDLQGLVDAELYSNGPCIKFLTFSHMDTAEEVVRRASDYLMEHYGQPYGLFAYTYDYKDYEKEWLEAAGFTVFRYLDEGARTLYHIPAPTLN